MTREEIERYLSTGKTKAVTVDLALAPGFPGFVRRVTLAAPNQVRVDFEQHGYDEGGAYFSAEYASLDDAIGAIERYIQRRLADWQNFARTGEYPELPADADPAVGAERLKLAIANGTVKLPDSSTFIIRGSDYWTQEPEAH